MKKHINPNSIEALIKVLASLSDSRREVLNYIAHNKGKTANELVFAFLRDGINYPINRITPRICELRKMGLIQVAKTRADKFTGYKAMTYITTAKANNMVKAFAKGAK